jgi:hypothetical protein
MNTTKETYEAPTIQEVGTVAELTQAVNKVGPGDAQFSVLASA